MKRKSFGTLGVSLWVVFALFGAFSAFDSVVCAQSASVPDLEQAQSFAFPFENVDLRPVITAVAVSPDRSKVYVGGDDRRVYAWDVASGEIAQTFSEGGDDWVRDVAFSPTTGEIATLSQLGELKIWDSKTQKLLREAKEKVVGAHGFAYSPNGKVIAVCGYANPIYIFGAEKLELQTIWRAPGESTTAISFSADGSLLAVGGRNGVVRVWTTKDGKVAFDLQGIGGRRVRAVAFSPDGKLLATGGDGREVELWNLADGRKVGSLPVASGKIFSISFCGNDKLATGDSFNVVKLWDVASKQLLAQGVGHTGTIATLQYDATDKTLFSGSFDTTVVKWKIQ